MATLDPESEVLTTRPPHPHPIVEKEKLPFYFDFFNIPLASAPLRLSNILCYWLKLFPFPPFCADFKHRHMDTYACIIFSHLHIKDSVIDNYVYMYMTSMALYLK